jgi:hypothetical protein
MCWFLRPVKASHGRLITLGAHPLACQLTTDFTSHQVIDACVADAFHLLDE